MGNPTLILINHFAAEIMLMAFLNQGCLWNLNVISPLMYQNAPDEFTHFLGMVKQKCALLRK